VRIRLPLAKRTGHPSHARHIVTFYPAGKRACAAAWRARDTGTTIAVYVLENAFPTNVDVAAGDPSSTTFTVTLTADELILEPTG
jgi:hypothetical protein